MSVHKESPFDKNALKARSIYTVLPVPYAYN